MGCGWNEVRGSGGFSDWMKCCPEWNVVRMCVWGGRGMHVGEVA